MNQSGKRTIDSSHGVGGGGVQAEGCTSGAGEAVEGGHGATRWPVAATRVTTSRSCKLPRPAPDLPCASR